jgi:hypothetical protein
MNRATEIAEQIDLTTAEGHNVRAFLLRGLNGERRLDTDVLEIKAFFAADDLGLLTEPPVRELNLLGREVAEILRPAPWRSRESDAVYLIRPNTSALQLRGALIGEAELIARLLTEHDMRAATNYTGDAGS